MRRAVKMWDTAKYWTDRAEAAVRHAKYKERPDVRARRIKTLEADKRRQERRIAESQKFLKMWQRAFGKQGSFAKRLETGTRIKLVVQAQSQPDNIAITPLLTATFVRPVHLVARG
jgi:hypothetical protein